MDSAAFRSYFPGLSRVVNLNSCSLPPLAAVVEQAVASMCGVMRDDPSPWSTFEEVVDEVRAKFADLIGADPAQIALVPNATTAAYQAASSQCWSKRPTILASDLEFPSIAQVWTAQERRGARHVSLAGCTTAENLLNRYQELTDDRVGLVSLPAVTYYESIRTPVKRIAALAKQRGARLFVDAYHAVGVEPVDVGELGCDYLVAGASKYLLGLPGVAFLYAREPEAGRPPQLTGWFGRPPADMFEPLSTAFAPGARRFETGTPPVPSMYAAGAALDLIGRLDLDRVRQHVVSLTSLARATLGADGLDVTGPTDPALAGAHVAVPVDDPAASARRLANQNIIVSSRANVIRLACHYFTSTEDVVTACRAIARSEVRR